MRTTYYSFIGALLLASCSETNPQYAPADSKLDRGAALALACANCHALPSTAIPDLSALSSAHIEEALNQYKAETTGTTVMHRLSGGYSDEDIKLIAETLGIESE